jgi:hypothetical protein
VPQTRREHYVAVPQLASPKSLELDPRAGEQAPPQVVV